jgi:hypothetical protein
VKSEGITVNATPLGDRWVIFRKQQGHICNFARRRGINRSESFGQKPAVQIKL